MQTVGSLFAVCVYVISGLFSFACFLEANHKMYYEVKCFLDSENFCILYISYIFHIYSVHAFLEHQISF